MLRLACCEIVPACLLMAVSICLLASSLVSALPELPRQQDITMRPRGLRNGTHAKIALVSPADMTAIHTRSTAGDVFVPAVVGLLCGLVVLFAAGWWRRWSGPLLMRRGATFLILFVCVYVLSITLSEHTQVPAMRLNTLDIARACITNAQGSAVSGGAGAAGDGRAMIAIDTSDADYAETYFSIPPSKRIDSIAYTHEPAADDLEAQLRAAFPPVGDEEGPALRPACQRDTDILQRHIQSVQYPRDCKSARILLRRWWWQYGYFAGLNTDVFHLHHAQVTGRLYMDLTEDTYLKDVCPSKGHSCVFRALTNCTVDDFKEEEVCYETECFATARVISFDHIGRSARVPCTTAPDDAQAWCAEAIATTNMNEIGRAIGLRRHGHQFFRTEFVRFMYRPNELLFNYTMISVHVRHGDFINGGIQFPTIAYAHVLRRLVEVSGLTTIFIGSDDDRVYEELPALMEKEFQGHPGTPKLSFRHIPREEAGVLYDATDKGAENYGRLGLALSAQLLLFGLSEVFLGTRVSQQGMLVQDMHPLECGRPKTYFDMSGDIWFDGLYFSSRLKNKHAGREWMCRLEAGQQGPDQLIYQWKGADNLQPGHCWWCAGIEP